MITLYEKNGSQPNTSEEIVVPNSQPSFFSKAKLNHIVRFFREGIWRIRLADLPRHKASLIRLGRIFLLSFRGFYNDRCRLNASALTFYSLLSIVPVAAMVFGIAKGFGFEKNLEIQLLERFSGQQEVLTNVIGFARALLDNTKGSMIAGIGIVVLFWTVIRLMGNIERSFNDIWKIKKARSFGRKFADYLAFILITPVLFFLSSSATVYISTQITQITQRVSLLGAVAPVIFFLLKFTPYVLVWVLFSLVYMLMPNTRVRFGAGVFGGIIAGTIFHLVQWAYIAFQIGIAKTNAIYGSFAALPLFLIWLQTSWLIVLLGAELAYAYQHVNAYEFEVDRKKISHRHKQLVALRIVQLVVDRFQSGHQPLTVPEIAENLHIPVYLGRQIVTLFVETGILSQLEIRSSGAPTFQPGIDTDRLTLHHVIHSLETFGDDRLQILEDDSTKRLAGTLQTIDETIQQLPENLPLKQYRPNST